MAAALARSDAAENPSTSGEVQTTAWDSLLVEVRRAAYKVAWIDWKVECLHEEEQETELELAKLAEAEDWEGHTAKRNALTAVRSELKDWLKESRAERTHMVSVSDKAIRAGLNSRLVSQVQLEQNTISRVLFAGLAVLDLTAMQQAEALNAMKQAVREIAFERVGDGPDARALGATPVALSYDITTGFPAT